MPVKIKPCDTAFSRCVKEANDWVCNRCGAQHERGSQGLHNSHIFSRSHRTIRWCKENGQSQCFSCHQWFGGNPADSGIWIAEKVGQGTIDILREKMNSRLKVPKKEEKEIAKHYREQLKIIETKRLNGETGYIDFISWQ